MTRGPYAVAVGVAALCVLASVTFAFHDPDLWQHLAVGRTLWQTHAIPHTQVWTWPTFGSPDVLPSWLFRALLWPFWEAGGVDGLFAWRWLTTFAAFGLAWAAARRMGATGAAPLVMLVWCALFWRQRSQVRPETLAGILLAGEVLLLEARRAAAGASPTPGPWWRDRAWGLVPIAVLWANTHLSWVLGFVVSGGYLLDDVWRRRHGRRPGVLALAIAAAALASLLNPFGWRALAQPFEYLTTWRHEPLYRTIGELMPVFPGYWRFHLRDALPAWLLVVGAGAVLRWRARGFDAAQALVMLVCIPQALATNRFLGYAALALAPFAARDVGDWVSRRRWPAALLAPMRRAALASAACLALVTPTLLQPIQGFGFGWEPTLYPERAADWIEQHGVRGRAFNTFAFGGYLLYRFHPDPGRLPFMDIHQAGTREIRERYVWALQDPGAWRDLDGLYRFDWVLLPRVLAGDPDLADFLDADSTWALVFADDAAALWLRRGGSCDSLAARDAFRWMPAGTRALGPLGLRLARDSTVRAAVEAELARAIASSPWNARAHTLAGNVAMIARDFASARAHYDEAVRQQPLEAQLLERQGLARLYAGDPAAALASFRERARRRPPWPEADLRVGQALAAMDRWEEARRAWKRSAERHPEIAAARDSLARSGR